MKKIYKYNLTERVGFPQRIFMVKGACLLSFKYQDSAMFGQGPKVWALVPADVAPDDTEIHTFVLHFTGEDIQDNEFYVGTDISPEGLVFHLFEIYE